MNNYEIEWRTDIINEILFDLGSNNGLFTNFIIFKIKIIDVSILVIYFQQTNK